MTNLSRHEMECMRITAADGYVELECIDCGWRTRYAYAVTFGMMNDYVHAHCDQFHWRQLTLGD